MQHLPSPAPETRGCDARRTLISYNHAILFSNEKKKKPHRSCWHFYVFCIGFPLCSLILESKGNE